MSGFAIHHQPDAVKRRLYREVLSLLAGDGWFVNIEHVASTSPLGTKLWEQQMVEALYAHHRQRDATLTPEQVRRQFVDRQDREANILAPVWDQCAWLREIGFEHVDCFFKSYELAVFGGRAPVDQTPGSANELG